MTFRLEEFEIRGFRPGNSADSADPTNADYVYNPRQPNSSVTYADGDPLAFNCRQQLVPSRDQCSVTIQQTGGTGGLDEFSYGDRLAFYAEVGESSANEDWLFTGLPRRYRRENVDDDTFELDMDTVRDFVSEILSMRQINRGFRNESIANVVTTIKTEAAPELDLTFQSPASRTIDIQFSRSNALEALNTIARRVGAVIGSDRNDIIYRDRSDLSPQFTLTDDDVVLPIDSRVDGTEVANNVFVRGGTGVQQGFAQTTQDSLSTVTNSTGDYESVAYSPQRDDVREVDVYTSTTGSGDALRARIQRDDGSGNPINDDDTSLDIGNATVQSGDLTNGGFTTFRVGAQNVPNDVVLFVDSPSDSGGQDVGIDSSTGDLTAKSFYSYPLDTRVPDQQSINSIRQHDMVIEIDGTSTKGAASDLGRAAVNRRTPADEIIEFEAGSWRAADLKPTDVIQVNRPDINASGQYVVMERAIETDGSRLAVDLSAQLLDSI